MNRRQPRNLAASVRDHLLNLARDRREDFQAILTRYAVERLLYRLSVSKYRDQFLLKGAMLFFDEDGLNFLAGTYHAWRSRNKKSPRPFRGEGQGEGSYKDIPGFCKSATTDEIAAPGYVLTPGRYVGAEEHEDDDEPFEDKMKRLTARLEEQFAESKRQQEIIRKNLRDLGHGF